jgi:predicted RNase H-like HicB family nuclease
VYSLWRRSKLTKRSCRLEPYQIDDFKWRVRKVYDWSGGFEMMIELDELEGCVSFGSTLKEAKVHLIESLRLWIQHHGEQLLPDIRDGAHLIYLDSPMDCEEFTYINQELKKI